MFYFCFFVNFDQWSIVTCCPSAGDLLWAPHLLCGFCSLSKNWLVGIGMSQKLGTSKFTMV